MFNFVVCISLLSITLGVAQSRFVYRPDIHREIKQDKVVATWQEAKEHCESQGAILASPIDSAHLNYMRSYIEVNDHTSAYFTGYKAVIHNDVPNYISVEGIFLEDLPDVVIDMIEKIDSEDGDCLSMDRREIRAVSCWERLPYICYTKVSNTTLNEPMKVSSSTPTVVNTEVRSVVLPELQSSEPLDVIKEVTTNVLDETSPSKLVNVITEVTTGVPVDVTTEVILDEPIEVFSSEPTDINMEVTTEPIEVSSSEPVDTSVEVTSDTSIETSFVLVDMVPEVTLDASTEVSLRDPAKVTSDSINVPTDETTSVLTDVPIETTEVAVDVQMNNANDGQDLSSGYSFYDTGSLYKLHDAPLPWINANATCVLEGGYLAVINDDVEAQLLAELGDIYPHVVWIGLKKIHGDWRSVQDDSLEVIFNKWSIIRANYKCGVIMSTGVLDDRDCDYPLPFICEKNVVSTDAEVY